jgi:hypothetical protein
MFVVELDWGLLYCSATELLQSASLHTATAIIYSPQNLRDLEICGTTLRRCVNLVDDVLLTAQPRFLLHSDHFAQLFDGLEMVYWTAVLSAERRDALTVHALMRDLEIETMQCMLKWIFALYLSRSTHRDLLNNNNHNTNHYHHNDYYHMNQSSVFDVSQSLRR